MLEAASPSVNDDATALLLQLVLFVSSFATAE